MRGWLTSLSEWSHLPVRDGFAELDLQIDKMRMLRDSYQAPSVQEQRQVRIAEMNRGSDLLFIQ
jgi:hypothetical protein